MRAPSTPCPASRRWPAQPEPSREAARAGRLCAARRRGGRGAGLARGARAVAQSARGDARCGSRAELGAGATGRRAWTARLWSPSAPPARPRASTAPARARCCSARGRRQRPQRGLWGSAGPG
jgi:hypothetical protein